MTNTSASLVSIVVPCYNQAHYLSDALQSVMRQTHSDCEVIVVNDGSTDDIAKVAREFRGARVLHQTNRGLAAARNAGLGASRGSFVTFLDADDRLVPQAVDRNLRLLAAHSDWAFVSGEHRYIDHSGQVLQEWTRTPVANDHFARLLEGNYIGMCATVLYRRSALELFGGFDGRWNPCEDYDLYLRISRVHPIGSHGELIAEYRRYGGGMSDDRARMLRATISTLRAHARSVGDDTDLRAAYRKGLDWWRKYYGTPLGDDLRRQIRAGRFGRKAAADAMVLLAYSPLDFLRVFSVR